MIKLTKLNGKSFALNAWLIEQVEETPDTMVTLNNGKKLIVTETMDQVILLCKEFYTSIHQGK
ncbi:flagellar protein FlbD [Bacillus tianshenii]|uniref:Flagellar protein FlbD n=1 Tax=Sutcliffiella tianshenii TaxID=1463404 RepID=A0ABS2NWI2_9BACI|nr:flagellar FlbD family protein [Bacillus tianshenii]MBM7618994.1 flagellar protein FlbD [Bacillus tianshenii]MCA1320918.1 flagellar FlbD family protein [Bacillus tianshenii]